MILDTGDIAQIARGWITQPNQPDSTPRMVAGSHLRHFASIFVRELVFPSGKTAVNAKTALIAAISASSVSTLKQPVDDDVGTVADLETKIDGFVQMQSQFGMHLLNRFDRPRDRLADSLPRTLGIELLANAATEALGRFDLIQNGLAFIASFLAAQDR